MDTPARAQDSRSRGCFHPPSPSHGQRSISGGLVKGRDELVCSEREKPPFTTNQPLTSPPLTLILRSDGEGGRKQATACPHTFAISKSTSIRFYDNHFRFSHNSQSVSQERRLDFIFDPISVLTHGSTIEEGSVRLMGWTRTHFASLLFQVNE